MGVLLFMMREIQFKTLHTKFVAMNRTEPLYGGQGTVRTTGCIYSKVTSLVLVFFLLLGSPLEDVEKLNFCKYAFCILLKKGIYFSYIEERDYL